GVAGPAAPCWELAAGPHDAQAEAAGLPAVPAVVAPAAAPADGSHSCSEAEAGSPWSGDPALRCFPDVERCSPADAVRSPESAPAGCQVADVVRSPEFAPARCSAVDAVRSEAYVPADCSAAEAPRSQAHAPAGCSVADAPPALRCSR